ncbi:MAG: 30S ribosomal protein S3 [Alphaproteobacteria bacterium]
MGQKVNPISLRLKINRTWDSRWFGKKEYADYLHQDLQIRDYIYKSFPQAAISKIVIERPTKKACINVYTARPGMLIGKKGTDIEKLKKHLSQICGIDVIINLIEVRKPEIEAKLVAESVAQQIERRVSFRRAMKRVMQSALRLGAKGIRVNCSGRLNGAEIARKEWYREGQIPLHTLRSDIDYARSVAKTPYGAVGIKVWIYKGDIKEHDSMAQDKKTNEYAVNR